MVHSIMLSSRYLLLTLIFILALYTLAPTALGHTSRHSIGCTYQFGRAEHEPAGSSGAR